MRLVPIALVLFCSFALVTACDMENLSREIAQHRLDIKKNTAQMPKMRPTKPRKKKTSNENMEVKISEKTQELNRLASMEANKTIVLLSPPEGVDELSYRTTQIGFHKGQIQHARETLISHRKVVETAPTRLGMAKGIKGIAQEEARIAMNEQHIRTHAEALGIPCNLPPSRPSSPNRLPSGGSQPQQFSGRTADPFPQSNPHPNTLPSVFGSPPQPPHSGLLSGQYRPPPHPPTAYAGAYSPSNLPPPGPQYQPGQYPPTGHLPHLGQQLYPEPPQTPPLAPPPYPGYTAPLGPYPPPLAPQPGQQPSGRRRRAENREDDWTEETASIQPPDAGQGRKKRK